MKMNNFPVSEELLPNDLIDAEKLWVTINGRKFSKDKLSMNK